MKNCRLPQIPSVLHLPKKVWQVEACRNWVCLGGVSSGSSTFGVGMGMQGESSLQVQVQESCFRPSGLQLDSPLFMPYVETIPSRCLGYV